uniref:Uncharacterized protein n=1 Tax=Ustilaginoidea virens TaxID=1159556 RepID=A0A1X9WE80_USTVR|nr:hypothetical protein [Ustilaginoidea virens]
MLLDLFKYAPMGVMSSSPTVDACGSHPNVGPRKLRNRVCHTLIVRPSNQRLSTFSLPPVVPSTYRIRVFSDPIQHLYYVSVGAGGRGTLIPNIGEGVGPRLRLFPPHKGPNPLVPRGLSCVTLFCSRVVLYLGPSTFFWHNIFWWLFPRSPCSLGQNCSSLLTLTLFAALHVRTSGASAPLRGILRSLGHLLRAFTWDIYTL